MAVLAAAPEDPCPLSSSRSPDHPRQLRFAAGLSALISLLFIGDSPAAYYRTAAGLGAGKPSARVAPRWPTQLYGGGAKSRVERRPRSWFRNPSQGTSNRATRREGKLTPPSPPPTGPLAYKSQATGVATPPVGDHEEFVLFYRTKELGEEWRPISVVSGGREADFLVKGALGENPGVYRDEIVRTLGEMVYRSEVKLEALDKKAAVALKDSLFEYAFKIRDRSVPAAWCQPTGLTVIPAKELLSLIPKRDIFPGSAAAGASTGGQEAGSSNATP